MQGMEECHIGSGAGSVSEHWSLEQTIGGRQESPERGRRLGASENSELGATDLQASLSGTKPRDGAVRDVIINVVHIGRKALIF